MDASLMVGTDTFQDGQVTFRPGPVYQCAQQGGFGVLDEINMARNEALAVLHSLLDYRRLLDVPGYDVVKLHGATRFIATMNYGYAGTRELNEALASRFAVLKLPVISAGTSAETLAGRVSRLCCLRRCSSITDVFFDLHKKCAAGEISDKAVDLRGLLDALHLMEKGLAPQLALAMGLTNKAFDEYEAALVRRRAGGQAAPAPGKAGAVCQVEGNFPNAGR
jgi:midasin (ATPase involved in ribosome maturation)